jgi:hypothetical protein
MNEMEKIDFKKKYRELYSASGKKVSEIVVPVLSYLMINGKGNPETSEDYAKALEAIYAVAYNLKFMLRFNKEIQPENYYDFTVGPMECLWSMDAEEFDPNNPDEWKWNILIVQPDYVNDGLFKKAVAEALKKKNLPTVSRLKLGRIHEGKALQMMHIGPYKKVGDTYTILKNALTLKTKKVSSTSHEIYLSDPRKTAPEKLKTILRISY